jgi:hypothetical protein
MTKRYGTILAAVVLCSVGSGTAAVEDPKALIAALPEFKRGPAAIDWLIDGSSYKAGLYKTANPNELVLANGLVARTFRIAPNAATVGFDNLVSGQALLRGVKPEAIVELDGVRYEVGGLKGQPNYAYLLPEWVDALKANPAALTIFGMEAGEPQERMGWKRVRHHAPGVEWPPKGVYLRMDYHMPDGAALGGAGGALPSELGRKQLLGVKFDGATTLPDGWTVHASKAHPRSSFENEGKTGEIYTPTHTCVYAERSLPAGTRLVETTIDVGTDKSASWGPAIALVWRDRVVKFNVATGAYDRDMKPAFGVFDGKNEVVNIGKGEPTFKTPVTLRLRIDDGVVYCEARCGGAWKTYRRVALGATAGDPKAVRVGKIGKTGGAGDNSGEKGDLVRLRILGLMAYGAADTEALVQAAPENDAATVVSVHYELYDGLPVMSKWLTVANGGKVGITVNRLSSEILALVERDSWVEVRDGVPVPRPDCLHVETDMAFSAFNHECGNRHVVHWRSDPQYRTQVNYARQTPCLLVVEPTYGPEQTVGPGKTFESFRTFELAYDSEERERRSLSLRRLYRTIAPWVTENPLMHHMKVARPEAVRRAIDQAAEVGFEMIILSFGSGFNMDNESAGYLDAWKSVADHARSKGIEIGSYSLLSSRNAGGGNMIVPPKGQRCTHGRCPALTSPWGQAYFKRLYKFFPRTGFTLFEHDGSYPGDVDITSRPPLQKGEKDSRWVQWRIISDFYKWCRANGIYLNVPDYYYLSGSNKCGMGYREVNWSLPRAHQVIHTRHNIFDGTWYKTPSMGWMFVPLSQYHGGGAAATIEPLDKHRDHYERMLYSNLALGVQACYRGPRLYDTEATKALVRKWVDWFKQYRDILESDLIHGRRADGRDIDWMLHVNPALEHKGMLVVFNPLKTDVTKTLKIPLYYTGLADEAKVSAMGAKPETHKLARDYTIDLPVTVPAEGMCWYVIE